ncbi:aspartate/glutamate racemase family protein [Bacillus amyloliquefaciens]|jgi:aspartate racemase|uniref:aspartate/glutamate racemase family protein n=1 Tax=Bacillus amyloliquefaciens TaxID=1390 RepID=UPI0015810709|nr:aspartate/glutamate racemase family protein [Bacillus amyloliquefaciens]NUI23924.1 aspartate/glutamate racemase family protein [Bacillus amyloliquefaciens]NUI32911.1 aspartate/glutamate racemase family protein [Bacillus amyloliquefaciens]NUI36617.1 aspartate/glutamate racemase family protein [Bacillus amyloliquefaciens]NUI70187.1 aspartate/glutamate racemase family protein [Bacillus amyloliquefaciens]NUI73882.1 aspartate/glutamate racemase family protein [Bacillus amyloliquefaciens]
MKTIGLIGGMSWESSAEYYRIINEEIKKKLGGLHSAKCLLYSVDFKEIEHYQSIGAWDKAGEALGEVARSLEKAGADFIVICTNTMHKVLGYIQEMITIPILHIADATAEQIIRQDIRSVGLLGTKYTMEQDFYKSRIASHDINVIVPDDDERELINNIIYQELCLGEIKQSSKNIYKKIINNLVDRGAEGIILGCTEIGLLVKVEDSEVPLFDTTLIHAQKAVNKSLSISS